MTRPTREQFEQAAAATLLGRHLTDVAYWDIATAAGSPNLAADWDRGDWHHVEVAVDLFTDRGPASVVGTDTYYPYGAEVLPSSYAGDEGFVSWPVAEHPHWRSRLDDPITAVRYFWETLTDGPGTTFDGRVVVPERTVVVPVAVRLDFSAGPVWFVVANPRWPDYDSVMVPGDEVMVVFTPEVMRWIGFPDDDFLQS